MKLGEGKGEQVLLLRILATLNVPTESAEVAISGCFCSINWPML